MELSEDAILKRSLRFPQHSRSGCSQGFERFGYSHYYHAHAEGNNESGNDPQPSLQVGLVGCDVLQPPEGSDEHSESQGYCDARDTLVNQ